ncbi:MAG: hypothetical protein DRI34_01350 [Deltaproteobacteria bacterium]|nr:MAG: hypothetical protein DRI34_01350 [Deltaproteobacteria bacterium]
MADTKSFSGGRRSIRAFSRLLGLSGSKAAGRIQRASWLEDHLELQIEVPGQTPVTLVLERSLGKQQTRPFLSTGLLDIWYQGAEIPESLAQHLEMQIKRWPRNIDHGRLRAVIVGDPERRPVEPQEQLQSPVTADTNEPGRQQVAERPADNTPSHHFEAGTWNITDSYGDFLGVETLGLMPYESVEAHNPFIRVSHSDLECVSFSPLEKVSNLNLVEYPWITERTENSIKEQEISFCTDLTETSVIMGCNQEVTALLEHLLTQYPRRTIIFSNTCLPATTAEDVMSVVDRFRSRAKLNISTHNRALVDDTPDMLEPLLVERRLRAQARTGQREKTAVNLVGFSRDEALEELRLLLADMGITVNSVILPAVNEQDIDVFPRASLNVFWKVSPSWKYFRQQLERGSDIPSIHPPGPYGVAGTTHWLEAIATALELSVDVDKVVRKHLAPRRRLWEQLQQQASTLTVGLVIRPVDIPFLEDPVWTAGIPLLPLLEELGFTITILMQTGASGGEGMRQRVLDLLSRPHACLLDSFDDLDSLRLLLAASPARAFLSNFVFDWRLSEAGKNRFSFSHFHKGISGAIDTLQGLLAICRLEFFNRYARVFRRTSLGLRPREE